MSGTPYLDTPSEVVHLVGGHGYHATGHLSGGILGSIYIYIMVLAIRYWHVCPTLLMLQVLRTLHRMSYTISQDSIALTSSLLRVMPSLY
ncbi:MAG: hypothetical protein GY781_20170 [Gammaproteobacteria bacterium]|nr:hypothetical protein [Gammaproteobacteria bacterium]